MSKSNKGPNKSKGTRDLTVKVKTAKGRKLSSTLWLQRQLNDPYVAAAQREGYRSRAAYKLIEIDEKYKLLKKGMKIVDLGSAPGGWAQVCSRISDSEKGKGRVVAIDILDMDPIAGVEFLKLDFNDDDAPDKLMDILDGDKVDAVISDMAASATGHRNTDHLRIMALCEMAYDFARQVLAPNGWYLAKVLQGGTENDLLTLLKQEFQTVRHVKPKASRQDSAESYVLATGFRGKN